MTENIKKIPKEEWEDCPYCDNEGGKNIGVRSNNERFPAPETAICDFCVENDYSVYNQKRIRERRKEKG